MTITDKRLELFREKIKTYDKDGGFIVYVEDEDNQDFDVELIEKFLSESITQTLAEERVRVKGEIGKKIEHWSKIHDDNMPHNTLIAYHADSCIRALDDLLSSLDITNNQTNI